MFPLRDDNPVGKTPYMTILLIGVNLAVFIYQFILGGRGGEEFIFKFGAIPFEITHFQQITPEPNFNVAFPTFLTIFTSMFLHGGFMHIISNMLYLWIFGDNIEYLMGSFRFLIFYLLAGLVASFSHIIMDPSSTVPMIGASGAISGVLGAYLLKFPKAKVLVVIFLFIIIQTIYVPAIIVLGFWFIMQLFNAFGELGLQGSGGVAWWAHIGGFIAGMALVNKFQKRKVTLNW
jgi:membrane associated rhomboid family serine protease